MPAPTLPRSSSASLALRAFLALVLLVGFYALGVAIAAGLLYLVYLLVVHGSRIPLKLVLIVLIAAGTILWSLLPRFDEFEPPGPRLEPGEHPRLFAVLHEIAEATGQAMPREVYLVPEVNAWVSSRGGLMGLGSRRIMGIGLPLLQLLNTSQLRAVLAHEFGHYHGGDVAVGPWLYQTRAAIGRTLQAFHEGGSALMHLPFEWYGSMFLRVTHGLSRHQEFQADALAATVVGPQALTDGLRIIHRTAPAHHAYFHSEVAPVLSAGFRPPMTEGFSRFIAVADVSKKLDEVLAEQLDEAHADPFDTHPPLAQRIAAVEGMPEPSASSDHERPAVELLEGLDGVEQSLVQHMRTGLPHRRMRAISWDEVGDRVCAEQCRQTARELAKHVGGMTAGTIPTRLPDLAGWTRAVIDEAGDASEEDLARHAASALGTVMLHQMAASGWSLEALPGAPIVAVRDGERLAPTEQLRALVDGDLTPQQWHAELGRLALTDLTLEPSRRRKGKSSDEDAAA